MMAYEIEKGVPLKPKYPFLEMDVGDSFVVPLVDRARPVRTAATRASKVYGKKFACRIQTDGSLRVWRIA